MTTYCFDLDGTLCTHTDGVYEKALPYVHRIKKVNELYDNGHTIIIDTARGSATNIDWYLETKRQLEEWGCKFHTLRVGKKPFADIYIDDKGINDKDFFNEGN